MRWAEAVDVEQTTRQWAAPAATRRPQPAPPPASPSCAICGGKPTEGVRYRAARGRSAAAAACRAGVPRCKAPTPTSDGAIAAALERASSDCASAARRLGVAYARGELGLARDERRAAQLYKAAAAAGDAAAQHNLGLMYMSGGKAPKALKWFRAAAAQDHAPSLYNLGTAVRRSARACRATRTKLRRSTGARQCSAQRRRPTRWGPSNRTRSPREWPSSRAPRAPAAAAALRRVICCCCELYAFTGVSRVRRKLARARWVRSTDPRLRSEPPPSIAPRRSSTPGAFVMVSFGFYDCSMARVASERASLIFTGRGSIPYRSAPCGAHR